MTMKPLISSITLCIAIASTNVSALVRTGVVESLDIDNNTFSIKTNSGKSATFTLNENTPVWVDGENKGPAALKEKQQVRLILPNNSTTPNRFIEAEIVAIDATQSTATIKQKGSTKEQTVRFSKFVNISGKVSQLAELEKGQLIKLRYSN